MSKRILLCFVLLAAAGIQHAHAAELAPFRVRNFSPLALMHGLATAEPARLGAAGRYSLRAGLTVASSATQSASGDEAVLLDGESYVTTLGLRYGVSDRLQVGVELPWVAHRGGVLDGFIDDWHDFFGLPGGDRESFPSDRLAYAYTNHHGETLALADSASGLGDVRLTAAWQLAADERSALSLLAAVKAPTGDAGELTGSGAWDVSLALSGQRDFPLASGRAALWGGVGGSWLGSGDVLPGLAEDWAASAWVGAGWSPLDWLAFKCQLDSHSALYDSDLDELGAAAVILTLGGTLGIGERTSLDIGVGEGLAVEASPDVTFHLELSHEF